MKKKILLITKHFLPVIGGTEIYNKNILEYLRNKDVDVDVLTLKFSKTQGISSDLFFGKHIKIIRLNISPPPEEFVTRILNFPLPRFCRYPLLYLYLFCSNIFAFILFLAVGSKILRGKRADVLYPVGGLFSVLVGVLLGKLFRIKVVGHFHANFELNSRSLLTKYLAKNILKRCNFVLTNSNDIKDDFVCLGITAEKIEVIHNWVNCKIFKPLDQIVCRKKLSLPKDKFIVLYATRLSVDKHIDLFMKAAEIISNKDKEIYFMVVGDGYRKKEILHLAQKHPQSVIYFGPKENNLLPGYINAADICWGNSDLKYIALSCIEALSCGIPIILSNKLHIYFGQKRAKLTVTEKTVPKNVGFLVDPDPEVLATRLIALARERQSLKSMKGNCLKFIKSTYGYNNAQKVFNILMK